ncbi:RipA family octameric membrane protein [Flavobacterium beibuense]|nr:hypothetical protein [Flavobacterium beibuense]
MEDNIETGNKENQSVKCEELIGLKERYEILIRARNFHYENFNKWMAYFYVIIASIILGFSYIISKNEKYSTDYEDELILLGIAGFTVSLFWYWANKGYYYWNINFITLVNHYEKNLLKFKEHERIYFVFANKSVQNNYFSPLSGANISTSKISIFLSYLFTLAFGSYTMTRLLKKCVCNMGVLIGISIPLTIVIILMFSIISKLCFSSHHRHFPDLDIDSSRDSDYDANNKLTT